MTNCKGKEMNSIKFSIRDRRGQTGRKRENDLKGKSSKKREESKKMRKKYEPPQFQVERMELEGELNRVTGISIVQHTIENKTDEDAEKEFEDPEDEEPVAKAKPKKSVWEMDDIEFNSIWDKFQ